MEIIKTWQEGNVCHDTQLGVSSIKRVNSRMEQKQHCLKVNTRTLSISTIIMKLVFEEIIS